MWNKAAKPKTKLPSIFPALSQVILVKSYIFQFTWRLFFHISESYPTFQSDKLSLFLVTRFCFSGGRLFITFCIRRTVFHSTYPKCPSERMLPAFFSTKARTWESAQMMIKKFTENLGCLIPSRQNNFKAYKINTISFCYTVGIIHYQYGFVTEHQQHDRSVPAFLFSFCRRECSGNPKWQVLPHIPAFRHSSSSVVPSRGRISQHLLAASFDSPATAQAAQDAAKDKQH